MAHLKEQYWMSDGSGRTRKERRSGAYKTYSPDKLCGLDLVFCGETVAACSKAEEAIRTLNERVRYLTNTEPLARLMMRAEAVASSRIEGLEVGVRKLLREEAYRKGDATSAALNVAKTQGASTETEVIGNIHAMSSAIDEATKADLIGTESILEIHRKLLAGSRLEPYAGVVRTQQNWIGGNPYNPIGAAYVPPCPEEVPELLDDLALFCNEEHISPLIQAALVHVQFETIHPFADGNGRTGRVLIHLILRRRRLAEHVVPPISLVLATQREDYLRFLDGYRYVGASGGKEAVDARNEWVEFFCAAAERAARDALGFEMKVREIQDGWKALVRPRKGSAAEALIDALPGMPVFSIEQAAKSLGRSREAVRLAVGVLEESGILKKTTDSRRNRYFEAVDIVSEFTSYERSLATESGDTRVEKPKRAVPYRRIG